MITPTTTQRETGQQVSSGAPWVTSDKKRQSSRLRGAARRRNIPYLALGAVLVAVCAASFLVVSLNLGDRTAVLALARAVTVGQVLSKQDLTEVDIGLDPRVRVIEAGRAADVVGATMSATLPSGALLTRESIGVAAVPVPGQAIAALSLKPGQVPAEVSAGAHVSVVLSPHPTAADATASVSPESWPGVITSVTSPPNEAATVVSVQLSRAAAHEIAAAPVGHLSIVLLPAGGR